MTRSIRRPGRLAAAAALRHLHLHNSYVSVHTVHCIRVSVFAFFVARRATCMDMVKVQLVFRLGQRKTVKVWHFSPDHIDCTTLKEVEENILQLYPDVISRRLGLLMKYQDSFAGEIVVESIPAVRT